jgi:hypothetical protein
MQIRPQRTNPPRTGSPYQTPAKRVNPKNSGVETLNGTPAGVVLNSA